MKILFKKIPDLVQEIRKRWILKVLRMGFSVMFMSVVFSVLIFLTLVLLFNLSPLFQTVYILIVSLLLIAVAGWLIVRPIWMGTNTKRIALFIEEKIPELEDRLNSIVEIGESASEQENSILIDNLIHDTLYKMRTVHLSTVLKRKVEPLLTYGVLGALVLFLTYTALFQNRIKEAFTTITFSLNPRTHFVQELIRISPGDVQIEKGESLEITAELKNRTDDDMMLSYQFGDGGWQQVLMESGLDRKSYLYRFLNIQEPFHYYVELDPNRSPEFFVSIYEFPKVVQIDLTYAYPTYTGLPVQVEENRGNIRGLQGAEVTLSVMTTGSVVSGEIIINDSESIALSPQGDSVFQGKIVIQDPGTYHILLTDEEGKNNKFPEEYRITPIEDELPLIRITDPQRDIRVNTVEEVLLAVSVSDDFGINKSVVQYSVNGMDEESIDLLDPALSGEKEISASTVFYLEDFFLEPGDVISYYIEAEDNFHVGEPVWSDMYFIEVTPFDADYRQVANQGGGEMSGGESSGSSQTVMNQQTIINATWNLLRQQNSMEPGEFEESSVALEQAQANLKDNIDQRIQSTTFTMEMATDETSQEIVSYLQSAVEEMGNAVEDLHDRDFREALTPERKALNYLLKADALNKEKLVQQQQSQMASSSGQSSGSQMEERMTELMELELDISKDKYEIQQQTPEQQNREMDEAMRKLEELARKQQRLAQNSRETLQQEEPDRRELERLQRDQQQLREEAEDLAQQMREMSRNNEQISSQMEERIEDIMQNMQESEEQMASNNMQQAVARQRQALNELNRLQRSLESSLSDNTREMLDEFVEDYNQLRQNEQQFGQELRDLNEEIQENEGRISDFDELEQLVEERQRLIEDLEDLTAQTSDIEEQARQQNPEIATQIRNLENDIEEQQIENYMNLSREWIDQGYLDSATMLEEEIQAALDQLESEMDALTERIPPTEEEMLSRSLEDVREMVDRFEDLLAERMPDTSEQDRSDQSQDQQNAQNQNSQNQGGGGMQDRNDAVRMERLLEQTEQLVDRIERDFQDDRGMQTAVEQFRQRYAADFRGDWLGEDADDYFKNNVYDPLSQLETVLLERWDEIELEKKLYETRKEEVPAEYQKMVDRYFEAISK